MIAEEAPPATASAAGRPPEVQSPAAGAVDVLSDEVLEQLCMCLPGRELLRFSAASRQLQGLASASATVWGHLARALLGEPLCQLHGALAARRSRRPGASFWAALFRRGRELRAVRWSLDLRAAFVRSVGEEDAEARLHDATVGSGHCTVGLGHLVVKVGGLRPQCTLEHLHAAVFDLRSLTISKLVLTPDSTKPERRLRHSACEVRPALTGGCPAVLVLGGCDDRTKQPCQGGLRLLHILELVNTDGPRVCVGRWHSVSADGQAPSSIWHHVCGSFDSGRKVVVFGGDFLRDDPEFVHISDRELPAHFVYVLDVDRATWARTVTSGPAPTWRSLHTGLTHRDVSSNSERLVVLGGCSERTPIFSSSSALAEMRGHALDLDRLAWLPQPEEGHRPAARLRFAAEKIGEWLLLYGGHDSDEIGERARLHKLNLRTLRWGTLEAHGREGRFPAAPAATLTAGLCLGGVQFGVLGITTVPKLDVLTLCNERESSDESLREEEADRAVGNATAMLDRHPDNADDDDDPHAGVVVAMQDGEGNVRRLRLSRLLLQRLMAGQATRGRAAGHRGDDDDDDDNDNNNHDNNNDDDDTSDGAY